MNAKLFCQQFGIAQDDASWIMHKHKNFDGDVKDWLDLVGTNLSKIPDTLIDAVKPVGLPLETKPKTKKTGETEIA